MDLESRIRELHNSGISRTRAAEHLGLPFGRFCLMIEAMGLDWPAHEWQPKDRAQKILIDDIWDTLDGHAKRKGLSRGGLRWRIKNGISLDAKVITPISREEIIRFKELLRQRVPAKHAAAIIGRQYNSLRIASKRPFPEDAAVQSATRECCSPAPIPSADGRVQVV